MVTDPMKLEAIRKFCEFQLEQHKDAGKCDTCDMALKILLILSGGNTVH